jgi:hypothetical protein
MSSKEKRKVEELLRRENNELNEEVGALKMKVEELDSGRIGRERAWKRRRCSSIIGKTSM